MRKKISIVGAGNVGATAAQWLAGQELGEIVLVDIVEDLPQGKGLDLLEAGPIAGFSTQIGGSNGYEATIGSDMVVITAGASRKPGMTRLDLLSINVPIVRQVAEEVAKSSPQAHILVVTNPLDVMAYAAWKTSGFPPERVYGMAGILDSARFRAFIALELGISPKDIQAQVLGGHGDQMVPLPRYSAVGGIPQPSSYPKSGSRPWSSAPARGAGR